MPDEVTAATGEEVTSGEVDAAKVSDTVKTEEPKFTQSDLNRIVKERLERKEAEITKAAEKARKEAEEKALTEQGEFKRLAEERAARIAELEPLQDKAARYEAALTAQLKTAREGLPKAVLTLLDRLDPAEQLEYIAANRAELMPEKSSPNGVGSNPNSSNGRGLTSEEREKARSQDRRNFSGFFH